MSLLFPLYLTGILAVSLPIVFHLIRRTPRGTTTFSSLMFLRPSPPRLSKHSRLENILLLILRATALILLALAFARPFLRESAFFNSMSARGRRVAVLVDTSASMRRAGMWDKALRQVEELLEGGSKGDQFALYTFDRKLQTQVAFPGAAVAGRQDQKQLIRDRLKQLHPSWSQTDLGIALMTLADELHDDQQSADEQDSAVSQIVLVSDVQVGSEVAALQAYEWPDKVRLAIKALEPEFPGNASLQLIADRSPAAERDGRLRVRVENNPSSPQQQFELVWETPERDDEEEKISVHVPAGESRVVRVPLPDEVHSDRLVLKGDEHSFDNTLYIAINERPTVPIGYWGADTVDDPQQMLFYLVRAFDSTKEIEFKILHQTQQPLDVLRERPRLIVVTRTPAEDELEQLRQFVREGGSALYVVSFSDGFEAQQQTLARLLESEKVEITEAEIRDYALLSNIRFDHPLFAPLADVRFNDFTKMHFWKHRAVALPEDPAIRVLASFDGGEPALLHREYDRGNLYVLTSGWHPADSQLALSSKFVPLLTGMVRNMAALKGNARGYHVDQPIRVPDDPHAQQWTVIDPQEKERLLPTEADSLESTDRPGIYTLKHNEQMYRYAVNVAPAESRTDQLAVEQLEQQGVVLGWHLDDAADLEQRRQQKDIELEGNQRIWQWLIVAALSILLVETWLAGRMSLSPRASKTYQGNPVS